ncbi:hypothetical protein QBC40DRAFT_157414, partial [Triangularia verruculosa]
QLNRIVFNKYHIILNTLYNFRPKLYKIKGYLAFIRTQLIFLTATLPPKDQLKF